MLQDQTASSSLGRVLGVGQCSADDLYRALDWLLDSCIQPVNADAHRAIQEAAQPIAGRASDCASSSPAPLPVSLPGP